MSNHELRWYHAKASLDFKGAFYLKRRRKMKTVKGTYDILPAEAQRWQVIEDMIRQLCWVYDYKEIRTPIFELTEVFKRENDSSDMVNKEMYTFQSGRESLTLRPEGTAGIIRSFVQNKMHGNADLPVKLYYVGAMFRHENPQKGRQRQFHQFGIENIGAKSPLVDAETIALGYSLIKAVGLSEIKVLVNTIGDEKSRSNYREALENYFKPCIHELCEDCQKRLDKNPLRILDCKVDQAHPKIKSAVEIKDYLTPESKEYFDKVLEALDALDIPYEVDPRLVRGLDYYTDTVFEVVSIHEEAGSQSTIFGGGRYDGLVEYFGGPSLSGIGFGVGMERLLLMAEAERVDFGLSDEIDVYVMSLGNVGTKPLEAATLCRAAGYKTEVNMVDRSMKSQFKSVDRKKAKVVIIVGEDEVKENKVAIKNIATQHQQVVELSNLIASIDQMFQVEEEHHCLCKGE